MNWLINIIPFLILLAVSATIIMMPYLTRNTASFGISVSQETYYSQPLKMMRRQYARINASVHAALVILYLLFIDQINALHIESFIGWVIPLMLVSSYAVHLIFYRKMKSFKASLPAAATSSNGILTIHTDFHKQKLNYSNKWFLIHGSITLLSAFLALSYYDTFPAVLPMQYDLQGHVTRVVDKSVPAVIGVNISQFAMILLFLFINWTIRRSKQQIHPDHPEQSAIANAVFRRKWSLFIIVTGLLVILLFSVIQLNFYYQLNPAILGAISLIVVLLVSLGAVWLAFTTGQGGSRLDKSRPSSTAPINDDNYWKLGGLYFNPQDPSLFIEKRAGIGWTMNFARPMSWVLFLGIIAIAVTTSLLAS